MPHTFDILKVLLTSGEQVWILEKSYKSKKYAGLAVLDSEGEYTTRYVARHTIEKVLETKKVVKQ